MQTNFNFYDRNVQSLVIYDLEDNDVSASDIAKQSDNLFYNIKIGNERYILPFSTLNSNLSKDKARDEFKRAFKATGSKSKISKLLVVEVDGKKAFVENV